MNRSVLLAVAVGFGVVAMQVGSAQAKNIKGQTPARAVNPLKTAQHQGGHLVSEPVHLGPASPTKSLPPALKNLGNDKFNTSLFGNTPVVTKPGPVWKNLGNDRFNTGLFNTNPVTWGGNPPRAPQGCGHDGCDHNGCDHDGCDHYGCDRHHDCHHSWDWMFCGDICYGNYYGNTCSDFDFCW